MKDNDKKVETIVDYITGNKIPDIGAEANRQALERFLVEEKGFLKEDISVNTPIELKIEGAIYKSRVDLVVSIDGRRLMAVKCAAGSLASREREILAAARITDVYQIPFAMVSDGKTAILLDTVSGKKIGEGLQQIPSRNEMATYLENAEIQAFPEERVYREKLIFRSYDSMDVNRS